MITISNLPDFLHASRGSKDFKEVKFVGINFSQDEWATYLYDYNFEDACFSNCEFHGTVFSKCNFSSAYIELCEFYNVEFHLCNFNFVNLVHSRLSKVRLSRTCFSLNSATGTVFDKIRTDEHTPFFHIMCPEEGSFIAYKKAYIKTSGQSMLKPVLVKLEIPKNAKRSSANSYKCRANMAKVLGFIGLKYSEDRDGYDIVGAIKLKADQCVQSGYDSKFTYPLGQTLKVDNFDEDRWSECSTGIHFFMNKEMARYYD